MPELTVRDVVGLPVLRQAGVQVVAGAAHLDRSVRWIHASEFADVAPLLREGDLVLTTGTGLPDAGAAGFAEYAAALRDAGAAGVVVELLRRWPRGVPEEFAQAFDAAGLPLVTLAHEVRFAAVTQAVGEVLIDRQLAELRDAQRVHEIFTELSFDQARPEAVLAAVQQLAGGTVVLESDRGQVLDYLAGPGGVSDFLADWQVRSSRVRVAGRTGWDERNGWLVTQLGSPERRWGRLVIESPQPPTQRLIAVAERAAATLALYQLHDRERDHLVRRTHFELIERLSRNPSSADVLRRCELAGFPVARRRFVGLRLRSLGLGESPRRSRGPVDDLAATVAAACAERKVPALVTEAEGDVQVLLSCPERGGIDAVVDRLGAAVARNHRARMSAGREAADAGAIGRSLREAGQVIDALAVDADTTIVHRLDDVHVRGLLTLLADDERLHLFVERELEPLRRHDRESALGLTDAVRALLSHPTSKTAAAASLHLSRPAFYARLEKAAQVLRADLDNPETRLSLHLALLAADIVATPDE